MSNNCGKTFSGYSSFPDDPEDSFHGKLLVAHIETCLDNEIIVPFKVGDNTSRTWIFTRTSEHVQLKHQHLHKDGTPDEISNYGGNADSGDSALVQAASHTELSQISLSFPADDYTRKLLPEAATNVWNITLLSNPENGYAGIVYYLTRHDKPRFKALLTLEPE
ncbi:MAG: hypothetical protein KJO88_06690 [Gammaproteobacteria bacterium]|nr:hypothetical protein [Gammaproteobacteria bacterium]